MNRKRGRSNGWYYVVAILISLSARSSAFHAPLMLSIDHRLKHQKRQQQPKFGSRWQYDSQVRCRPVSCSNHYTNCQRLSSSSSSSLLLSSTPTSSDSEVLHYDDNKQDQDSKMDVAINVTSSILQDSVVKWKADAARIRLEAEKLDVELTIQKMKTIEDKLSNTKWIEKRTLEEIDQLERQLQQLQLKVMPKNDKEDDENNNSQLPKTQRKNYEANKSSNDSSDDGNANSKSLFNPSSSRFFNNRGNQEKEESSSQGKQNFMTQLLAAASAQQQQLLKDNPTTDTTQSKTAASTTTTSVLPGVQIIKDENKQDSIVINLDASSFLDSDNNDRRYTTENDSSNRIEEKRGLSGFDPNDLELYLPIANEIEKTMVNATANEKLDAFRSSPVLQTHFQMKIASLLIQPIKDIQEMEYLKQNYLTSSSRVEKESIKRRIDKLQTYIEKEDPILTTNPSLQFKKLQPLSDNERKQRLDAVQALPEVLQTLYKKRINLEYNDDIEFAIELDYYEEYIRLLEEVHTIVPLEDESVRKDIVQAIETIPIRTRDYFAKTIGLIPGNYTTNDILAELCNNKGSDDDDDDDDVLDLMNGSSGIDVAKWSTMIRNGFTVEATKDKKSKNEYGGYGELPEYDDIGFIDRSRYVEEFYPAIARMEGKLPSLDDVTELIQTGIDKKAFMVTSKPERVVGGWYIRGRNLLDNDDGGTVLVERIQKSLDKNSIECKDRIQFFYVPDPAPLLDEDFEMEHLSEPILVITSKEEDPTISFYQYSNPLTKSAVSLFGLMSLLLIAVGSTALQPGIQDRVTEITTLGGNPSDLAFLVDNVSQVFTSILAIQLAHEVGHRIIAWKDKFQVGMPTFLPSIQLGLLGAITPLKSAPPNLKSMFDFAIAGPLVGLVVSLGLLATGLDITAQMSLDQLADLPVFPSYIFLASELGGGLAEFFLGKGAITQGDVDTLLTLHPFAIAGIVGLLSNSLALLPLGNTDGGRIAVAMFGRRGAYIVKSCTTVLLCVIGLFGFDQSRLFLVYVIFTQFWQRELETPAINEVEELDFLRGAIGIVTALVVALALVPMQ